MPAAPCVAAAVTAAMFHRRWLADPPARTKSFAVLMIDPDGRRGLGSVHWVAYGIAAARTEVKQGEGDTPSSAS